MAGLCTSALRGNTDADKIAPNTTAELMQFCLILVTIWTPGQVEPQQSTVLSTLHVWQAGVWGLRARVGGQILVEWAPPWVGRKRTARAPGQQNKIVNSGNSGD